MDVYRSIRTRVAVRGFSPEPIPEPVIKKILRAGRWAPSQRNRQPWHFIVIRDRQTLTQLGSLTSSGSYIADAPLAVAIVMDNARMPQFDAGRLIENMLLVAWSEGLGTCFVGGFNHEKVKGFCIYLSPWISLPSCPMATPQRQRNPAERVESH